MVNRGASVSRAAVAWAAMRRTLERELKLRAGEGFELPDLGGEELEPRVFVSTYYDAPDLRLARAGVTLRHRTENGRGLWQLKLPRRGSRLELELAGPKSRPPEEELRLLVGTHLQPHSFRNLEIAQEIRVPLIQAVTSELIEEMGENTYVRSCRRPGGNALELQICIKPLH